MIEESLPIGWNSVSLKDVCNHKDGLRRGPFGSAIKKEFFVPDGYKVYEQSNAIYNDTSRGKYFITRRKYEELINFAVKEGDLLVSCSGTLGRITLVPSNFIPGVINQALLRIRTIPEVLNTKYFLFFFRSEFFQRLIFEQSQGTAMNNLIGIKDFKLLNLPLPPLAEQYHIVAKIEELFSELDKGVDLLKTAQQQLKIYRQAVLKYAFEGKLTNPNLPEGELPEGWHTETLAKLGTWRGGGTPSKSVSAYWEKGTIDWVTSKDMKSDIIKSTLDRITADSISASSAKLIPPYSVLLVMRSGILRRTLPIALIEHEVTINQDLQAITPHNIYHKYLFWSLKAFSETIRKECSKDGTTVESIDSASLKRFSMPIAPKHEQIKIVQEIESRLSVCDKIEESIEQGLQQAEALRQSILKKAFEGKLVPQDPNDEPASVLLERIKTERASIQPVRKTKKVK